MESLRGQVISIRAQIGLFWGLNSIYIRSLPSPGGHGGYPFDLSYFIVKSRRESIPKLIIFFDTRWFAISIFGATYTANLAAFLTINKYEHPIKSIDDLANQDRVKFGTGKGQLEKMLR